MNARTLTALLAAGAALLPASGIAQDTLAPRVDRLEREMRAVQRKVFPDGAGQQLVQPDIRPATTAGSAGSATPVTDLIARVDALENQVATLTGQVEQANFKLGQVERRLAALEARPVAAADTAPAPATAPVRTPAAATAATAPPKPPVVSPARAGAVAAIERPSSGDAGEDAYLYGYRLWEAKFYPEAATQLEAAAKKYPKHRRASYSRNLHGRALLDDGKPASASKVLLDNYQTDPKGERAPDSLAYLAEALTRQKMAKQACEALAEMTDVYPDVVTGRLSTKVAREKKAAGCK